MKFGILPITATIFICLNFQPSYSQDTLDISFWPHIARVSDFKMGTFRGTPCDDTEVRNYAGLPAWKNYGEWLSECDSLEDAYEDSIFAAMSLEKKLKEAEEKRRIDEEIANMDFDVEVDMDAMWDNTMWEEITEVAETEYFETENITAVAGVRGAEAEDEALHHLYYRKSMRGPSRHELMEAYGKLRNRISDLKKIDNKHPELEKLNSYIKHLEKKIKV